MTKKILLASAALAFASFAVAPAQAAGPWTGIYLGGHVGGIWGTVDTTQVFKNSAFIDSANGSTFDFKPNGVIGGLQFGYNYQMSSWVFGLEVSGSESDFDQTRLRSPDDVTTVQSEWNASAAARAGYVYNQNSLIYVKGGYAIADVQHSVMDTVGTGGDVGRFGTNDNQDGWTAGAGFEHMLSSDVSFGIEYDYTDLGTTSHSVSPGAVNDIDAKLQTVSARLNWHWNPSF